MAEPVSSESGVSGREAALEALAEIRADLVNSDEWENDTLERYLEALEALLGSIERHYINTHQPVPTNAWVLMASAIRGARYYE